MRASMVTAAAVVIASNLMGCERLRALGSSKHDLGKFEGKIHLDVMATGLARTYAGARWTLDMEVKGDRVRIESTSPALGSDTRIMDRPNGKAYVLDATSRTYRETTLDGPPPHEPKAVVTNTGKVDKVAGIDCSIVTVFEPSSHVRTESCVSKGVSLAGFGMFPWEVLTGGTGFDEILKDGVALRSELYSASGQLEAKMEATAITPTKIAEADVTVPSNYTLTR